MELFVPGRICLFGEHSDWAGGYRAQNPEIPPGRAIIAGTAQGISARVGRHADALWLESVVPEADSQGIPLDEGSLLCAARSGGFWSYVAGVAYEVSRRRAVGGLHLSNHAMDLPLRKGLSSSAAISVLTARAFNRLYDLGLSVHDEMELAYQGEILTGSRCGRMDQACAFGPRPVLLTFDGDRMEAEELAVGGTIDLLLVDLRARKETRKILADLHRAYPFARDEAARGLHRLLGEINLDVTDRAAQALARGDAERLGILMTEAQELFDRWAAPLCPDQLAAPALHRLLADEAVQRLTWGGKGVGSQGDGAAQLVARSPAAREEARRVIEAELGMGCMELPVGARRAD